MHRHKGHALVSFVGHCISSWGPPASSGPGWAVRPGGCAASARAALPWEYRLTQEMWERRVYMQVSSAVTYVIYKLSCKVLLRLYIWCVCACACVQADQAYQTTLGRKWRETMHQSSADAKRDDDKGPRLWREGNMLFSEVKWFAIINLITHPLL